MILRDGKDPVPLALQISGERTEVKGLGIGVKRISWFLPGNLFSRIMLRVGLHADLGTDGQVTFRVFGNDAELHKTELRGTAQSVPIDLPITGVTNLAFLASPINRSKATTWCSPTHADPNRSVRRFTTRCRRAVGVPTPRG